jgi:hypothetical protein
LFTESRQDLYGIAVGMSDSMWLAVAAPGFDTNPDGSQNDAGRVYLYRQVPARPPFIGADR